MPLNRTVVAPDNLGSLKSSDFNSSISVQAFLASGRRFFFRLHLSVRIRQRSWIMAQLASSDDPQGFLFSLQVEPPASCHIVLPVLTEESAGKELHHGCRRDDDFMIKSE